MSGNGTFVSNSEGHVDVNSMSRDMREIIAYAREYANEQKNVLSTAISNLSAVVGSYNPTIPYINTLPPTVTKPVLPTRPSFAPLNLNTNYPDGYIPEPNLQDYGITDFTFTSPDAPVEINDSFSWTEAQYTSDIWESLFGRVHSAILNGDYGLSVAAHNALLALERETRRRNQEREFRSANDAVGELGWNLSSGHRAKVLADFSAEVLKRDQDALNNITVKNFEIANDNQKFFIGAGTNLENILRATFDAAQNRSLDAAKAVKEYLNKFVSTNTQLFLAKFEGIKIKFEAIKARISAIAERNNSEVQVFLGRAQVIESKIRVITETNKGLVDTRKADIDTYLAELQAATSEFSMLIEEIKVNQTAVKMEIDKEIGIETLRVQAFSDRSKLAEAAAMGIANIGSQGVASALGAVNTNLGSSYSGQEGVQEHWQHSDEIRESHDYQEEAM